MSLLDSNTPGAESRDPHEVMDDLRPGEPSEPASESQRNGAPFVAPVPVGRYKDDSEAEPHDEITDRERLMAARLLTVIRWAGANPARLAIVAKLLGIDDRRQAQISREHRVSESQISKAMEEGREFLRKAQTA
jgi:DNA-directed RNA polymerase specialized sigma24 family protein